MKKHHYLCCSALLYTLCFNTVSAQENTLPDNGNVGIGTTNPTEKLQVNGSARIDSMLVVRDSMIVHKGTVMEDNLTVQGDLKLNGNGYFNQPIYYSNYPELNSTAESPRLLGTDASGMLKSLSFQELIHGDFLPCMPDASGDYLPYWKSDANKLFVNCPDTRVGINTNSPSHHLHIVGDQLTEGSGQFSKFGINTTPNVFSALNVNTGNTFGAAVEITTDNPAQYTKLLYMHANSPGTEIMKVIADSDSPDIVRFMLTADGYLQIHNGQEKTLQLDTDGLLHARKVRVDVVNWPDYVFEQNYMFPSIEEVESYIADHHHLPGIPDAASMEQNGLDVTEANKMLMEQLEEQMLYIIQLKNELETLKAEVQTLKKGDER